MEILPDNVTIDYNAPGLKLIKHYRTGYLWVHIPFTIIWVTFIVKIIPAFLFDGFPDLISFLPLLHVCAGFYLIYYCLTSLINKTEIAFEYDTFCIQDSPIPMGNTGTFATADIEGFYVYEKAGFNHQRKNIFQVRAKLRDGKSVKIIRRIYTHQECEYLVKKFNKAIGYQE